MKWNENLQKILGETIFWLSRSSSSVQSIKFFNSRPVILKIDVKVVNFKFC